MPELPEVEALAADLRGRLVGRVIRRVDVTEIAALKTFDPSVDALRGAAFTSADRRGKHLVLGVEGGLFLVLHLARSGWVRWREAAPRPTAGRGRGPLAARAILEASDGQAAAGPDGIGPGAGGDGFDVTEQATHKRLAIHVVHHPDQVLSIATLGPEPLDDAFTEERFAAILAHAGRAQIKGVLRDQQRIAGIGNAYSDEILHAARMSPFHPASMPADEVHRLYEALRQVLGDAVERAMGVPAASLKAEKRQGMRVHGRKGEACPVCGDTVRQVIYADSTFEYCATCQTGGKPLADRVLSRLGVRR
ncbi:Fpg/Nei family DNA glycosylase [Agrococcus carbonis]|uniref:Formamidopyrimidine-DNA glycosylase n=1 Tax=Agrococcus carbonis TaxID=684552 RepID=A0A1H1PG83_9MICO|nr:DNA-formamidopyrimidine glycosylase family protein [Agrococcus carbonis]SDS10308.1 formamidopyrimidine-DNA glycosylase [Agrococcus carbonis]